MLARVSCVLPLKLKILSLDGEGGLEELSPF